MKIVRNIVCILFSLVFINAGLNKFLNYMPMPPMDADTLRLMEAIGTIKWLMPLVGFMEIMGGLLFLLPRTRLLGALVLFPILIGIIVHHTIFAPSGLVMVIVLFAINLWILFNNKHKLSLLVS